MSLTSLAGQAGLGVVERDPMGELHRVYRQCREALYRYAFVRVGFDAHLAEDLLQQLWVQATRGAERVPPDQMEYWLRAILTNLVRTHWRRQRARPVHVPLPDARYAAGLADQLEAGDLPDHVLARQEVREQLLLAITALPASEQDLIVGHYFEDRSHAELAERMGLSARAIEGRLYRARQSLRHSLRHLES